MPRASRLKDGPGGTRAAKDKPKPLTKAELEDWADNLPLNFLQCRAKYHRMIEKESWPVGKGYGTRFRCVSCRVEQVEIINAAGFVVEKSPPKYPKGYLAPKGAGRASKERNAMIRIRARRRSYNASVGK